MLNDNIVWIVGALVALYAWKQGWFDKKSEQKIQYVQTPPVQKYQQTFDGSVPVKVSIEVDNEKGK